jgi:hypothetical protein
MGALLKLQGLGREQEAVTDLARFQELAQVSTRDVRFFQVGPLTRVEGQQHLPAGTGPRAVLVRLPRSHPEAERVTTMIAIRESRLVRSEAQSPKRVSIALVSFAERCAAVSVLVSILTATAEPHVRVPRGAFSSPGRTDVPLVIVNETSGERPSLR